MLNYKERIKYFMVESYDCTDIIKYNVFKDCLMTQKNDFDIVLRKTGKIQISAHRPIPIMPKNRCTQTHKKKKYTNIPPVIFSEWVELCIILILFLHI